MYEKFLTTESISKSWQTIILVTIYVVIRMLSFALTGHEIIQAGLTFIILMFFGVLFYGNHTQAWYFVLGELLLGGNGHFLEFFGLSIRSILLVTFLLFWIFHAIYTKETYKLKVPHHLFYFLIALGVWIFSSSVIGLYNGNPPLSVIQDLAPYAFFALILPTYHILDEKKGRDFVVRLLIAFLIGSTIFSLFTFFIFTTGTEVIHGEYYKWYRDAVGGKITDISTGFFRIVAPEHLLVVPILLLLASIISRREKHHAWWYALIFLSVIVLTLNLSRTYFLAILVGLLILKIRHKFSPWASVSIGIISLFFALFTSTHMIVSGGDTGWGLISNRFASIGKPQLETSTYTRTALLGPIGELIREKPIIGHGLGTTLTFWDSRTLKTIKTTQFDWGYFELWAEIGAIGLMLFLLLLGLIAYNLVEIMLKSNDYQDFHVGILAALVSLVIMNITAPVLFHVLGIFSLSLMIVVATARENALNHIVTTLYRVFRRI